MKWTERFTAFCDITGVSSHQEAAVKLGTNAYHIHRWLTTGTAPSAYVASMMRRMCVMDLAQEKEAMWNTIMTDSYSCGESFYKRCLASGSDLAISMSITVVTLKVIAAFCRDERIDLASMIVHRDSVFGSWPAWERVTITPSNPAVSHVAVRLVVSHSAGDNADYTVAGEVHVGQVVKFHVAAKVSDYAIRRVTEETRNTFLSIIKTYGRTSKKVRRQGTGKSKRSGIQRRRRSEDENAAPDTVQRQQ